MKNRAYAILALVALSSCRQLSNALAPDVPLDAKAIAPTVEVICTRHDDYVTADPDLTDAQKAGLMLDTALLREAVESALGR